MFYRWTRDLHLYFGLFISPFLLVFAFSVFFLNHGKVAPDAGTSVETRHNIQIPEDVERAQGKDAIARAQDILRQMHANWIFEARSTCRRLRHRGNSHSTSAGRPMRARCEST